MLRNECSIDKKLILNDTNTDSVAFRKEENLYCGGGTDCNINKACRHGNYSSLQEANNACKNTDLCKLVMDHRCDNKRPFELCNSGRVYNSTEGSCI